MWRLRFFIQGLHDLATPENHYDAEEAGKFAISGKEVDIRNWHRQKHFANFDLDVRQSYQFIDLPESKLTVLNVRQFEGYPIEVAVFRDFVEFSRAREARLRNYHRQF